MVVVAMASAFATLQTAAMAIVLLQQMQQYQLHHQLLHYRHHHQMVNVAVRMERCVTMFSVTAVEATVSAVTDSLLAVRDGEPGDPNAVPSY
jgi:hypothetical protein